MSIFNWVLAIVTLLAMVYGYFHGIIRQLGSVLGFILGVVFARLYGGKLAAFMIHDNPAGQQILLTVLAYLVVFVVVFAACRLIGYFFHKIISTIHLGCIDRILGTLYTPTIWMIWISLALNLWVAIAPNSAPKDEIAQKITDLAPSIFGAESAAELLKEMHVNI